jgi:hypothetical protein
MSYSSSVSTNNDNNNNNATSGTFVSLAQDVKNELYKIVRTSTKPS